MKLLWALPLFLIEKKQLLKFNTRYLLQLLIICIKRLVLMLKMKAEKNKGEYLKSKVGVQPHHLLKIRRNKKYNE